MISIGLRYEVTANLDTDDGLVDGAGEILKQIQKDDSSYVIACLIDLDDSDVGLKIKKKLGRKDGLVTITRVTRDLTIGLSEIRKICRSIPIPASTV